MSLMRFSQSLLERDLLPDAVIRLCIRKLLGATLTREARGGEAAVIRRQNGIVMALKKGPIAIETAKANEQHYELPTEFFKLVLGRHLKYSCGLWEEAQADLDASELAMLGLTAKRAQIQDGQKILELGCGWGSLSLYLAERFPTCTITGVSNSKTQKTHIDAEAARRGLKNLTIVTADMRDFTIADKFDRVVSVEMFEHMRNYQKLLSTIAGFLKPDGKLFVHIFTHRRYTYLYDPEDESDWIARYFFTGGTMPGDRLFYEFGEDLKITEHWRLSGTHYQKTCRAWLQRMDSNRRRVSEIMKETYGRDHRKWFVYWRVFFMSCEELFGFRSGEEWMVSHYLFKKKNR